jgi:arabinofuranosyltransferase
MFNFFLTGWVYACIFLPQHSVHRIFGISSATGLLYLTRPDGLLFAAASLLLIGIDLWPQIRQRTGIPGKLVATLPLAVIPIHLIWRKSFYGEWLPNTYMAKSVSGLLWVKSGLRYSLSFVMEYALWFWLALVILVVINALRHRNWVGRLRTQVEFFEFFAIRAVVCLAIAGHFAYYTLLIGGDHFEFRVYSYLIPLLFVSSLWLLNRLGANWKNSALFLALFVACSWVIPWTHWAVTHNLNTREETLALKASVADALQTSFPRLPAPALAYFRFYDQLQFWLIGHAVCTRHQEHKIFHEVLLESMPSRAAGLHLPTAGYPVLVHWSIGVMSWVLPRVNVIDGWGLNDYVIARNPALITEGMAHARQAPRGYIECFMPNVTVDWDKGVEIQPREVPLTAEKIIDCEARFSAIVVNLLANPVENPKPLFRKKRLLQ